MTGAAPTDGAADFEPHRRRLAGLAYRMLGSVADAQDVVQDAWLRWRAVDRTTVDDPRAFLARIVTRLCLDRLKSARAQRELYVGPWLPEPVMDEGSFGLEPGAEAALDLSAALMLALERLSPLERAAFLMHDVFDASFEEVGAAIGRPAATCRQLALRARRHVQAARPRFAVSADEGERIAAAFRDAAAAGDATALSRLLAEQALFVADGGGKRRAVMNPIRGRDRIVRLLAGLARKSPGPARTYLARIGGRPGYVTLQADGTLQTTALEIDDGVIVAVHVVRNPDKLRHVTPPA